MNHRFKNLKISSALRFSSRRQNEGRMILYATAIKYRYSRKQLTDRFLCACTLCYADKRTKFYGETFTSCMGISKFAPRSALLAFRNHFPFKLVRLAGPQCKYGFQYEYICLCLIAACGMEW